MKFQNKFLDLMQQQIFKKLIKDLKHHPIMQKVDRICLFSVKKALHLTATFIERTKNPCA